MVVKAPPMQPPKARRNIPEDGEEFEKFLDKELDKLLEQAKLNAKPKKKGKPPKKKSVIMAQKRRWKIRAGDEVYVRLRDERGKKGIVKRVLHDTDQVIVENVNVGLVEYLDEQKLEPVEIHEERPFGYGSVMLIDPSDGKPTRVRWAYLADGTRVRESVRTGSMIPFPNKTIVPDRTVYPSDTPSDLVLEKTFTGR